MQQNAEYERRLLPLLGNSIDRHFYINLVGVSYKNSDNTSRKEAIRELEEHQKLELFSEPFNKFDQNAILVRTRDGRGLGHLDRRLAGEVSRSLKGGILWSCYVRRVLHASGTKNWGVTVCMVKHSKKSEQIDPEPVMSGPECLVKYELDYTPVIRTANPQPTNVGLWVLIVVTLLVFFAVVTQRC